MNNNNNNAKTDIRGFIPVIRYDPVMGASINFVDLSMPKELRIQDTYMNKPVFTIDKRTR